MDKNKTFIIAGISVAIIVAILTTVYGVYKYSTLSFSQKYSHQLAKARSLLEDEYSKEVFDYITNFTSNCLKYNNTSCKRIIDRKCEMEYKEQFNKLAKKSKDPVDKIKREDVVIDGGVSPITAFEKKSLYYTGNKGKIIGFEPDLSCLPEIKKELSNYNNIEIYPFGLWKSNKTMKLWRNGVPFASSVKKNWSICGIRTRNNYVNAKFIKLDDFIKENNIQRLDYVRLNIEGSELEALIGGEDALSHFKPNLHIHIDHHPTQLFSIILYLNSLNLNYKFYMNLTGPPHCKEYCYDLFATTNN